jgi:hypothetical protein
MKGDNRAECYANGVKVCRPAPDPMTTTPIVQHVTVTQHDGATRCFTVEVSGVDGMNGTSAKYKDGSGDEFASAGIPSGCDQDARLLCGGEAHPIDRCAPGCRLNAAVFAGECELGECSCP